MASIVLKNIRFEYQYAFDEQNRNVQFIKNKRDKKIIWYEALSIMYEMNNQRIKQGKKLIKMDDSIKGIKELLGEQNDQCFDFMRNWG